MAGRASESAQHARARADELLEFSNAPRRWRRGSRGHEPPFGGQSVQPILMSPTGAAAPRDQVPAPLIEIE